MIFYQLPLHSIHNDLVGASLSIAASSPLINWRVLSHQPSSENRVQAGLLSSGVKYWCLRQFSPVHLGATAWVPESAYGDQATDHLTMLQHLQSLADVIERNLRDVRRQLALTDE